MRETILVPLDGSKVGESALPYVEDLLSKLSPEVEKELILLRVLSPVMVTMASGEGQLPDSYATEKEREAQEKDALDYLNTVSVTLRNKGAVVTVRVAMGDTPAEIIKVAEEADVDLIAMSTHGRSGLSRWAFGSVTEKVLRSEGRIPICVVRARKES